MTKIQTINLRYKAEGLSKIKKELIQLKKLFDRVVISGKKAGLTKEEIANMIKFELND